MAEASKNHVKRVYDKDGDNSNKLEEQPINLVVATEKPEFMIPKQRKVLNDVCLESINEQNFSAVSSDGLEKTGSSIEKDFEMTPPSPPPPTPVATKLLNNAQVLGKNLLNEHEMDEDDSAIEKWEDPCAPPPPPPLPTRRLVSNGTNNFTAKKLKDALEDAINKIEAKQETKVNESRRVLDGIENCLKTDKLEMSGVHKMEPCVNESLKESLATSQAVVVHPKNRKPEAILQIERTIKINKLLERQNQKQSPVTKDAIPMPAPNKYNVDIQKDEISLKEMAKPSRTLKLNAHQPNSNMHQCDNEVHILQALPARSSTPYTSTLASGIGVNADLEHGPRYMCPVEENFALDGIDQQNHNQQQRKKRVFLASNAKSIWTNSELSHLPAPLPEAQYSSASQGCKILRYSRANMLEIRNEMINAFNACSEELVSFMPRIATCDDIELEARLRRLNLWRIVDSNNKQITRNTGKIKMRQNAECIPQSYKYRNRPQVVVDDSIIKSEPPQPDLKDNTMFNPRRIGSGRLYQSKWSPNTNYNKSYYQSASSLKQQGNDDINENTILQADGNGSGKMNNFPSTAQPLPTFTNSLKDSEKNQEIDKKLNNVNENYVKRVMSGFLFVSNPKSRESEERYNRRYRNQSEEPEWFSGGPTSRLDTIELCGFDDDKELLHIPNDIGGKNKSSLYVQDNSNVPCNWQSNTMVNNRKVVSKNMAKNEENQINYIPQMKSHKDNIPSQQEADKLPKRAFLYEQLEINSFDINNNNKQSVQPPSQNCQINYVRSTDGDDTAGCDHQQLSNSSSKFMSFFEEKRVLSSASLNEKSEKSGPSKTLHKFFKGAPNAQHSQTVDRFDSSTGTTLHHKNVLSQMPSVDQLEAKWRKNSLVQISNENDRNRNSDSKSENFQKLIGALNTCRGSGRPVTPNDNTMERQQSKPAIAHHQLPANGSPNLNSCAISNIVFQQQQFQQQQQKQQMIIQQQQKHASLLASLQLKSILSRTDTQVLLLRLAKGEISKHGLLVQLANPRLPSHDRDTITAVLQFTNTQQQQQHHQQQLEMLSNNLITSQLQNLHNLSVIQQSFVRQQHQQQLHWNQKPQPQQHQISQQDLQYRTNLIMQNALLKRKFKEETSKLFQFNTTAPIGKPFLCTGNQRMQEGSTLHPGQAVQQSGNNRNRSSASDNITHFQYYPEVATNMNGDESQMQFDSSDYHQQRDTSYFNIKHDRQQQPQKYVTNNKPCRSQKLPKQPCSHQ